MKQYIKKNKYDVYNKIVKVIKSCTNIHHYNCTAKLIRNFRIMYNDMYLYTSLKYRLDSKLENLCH